MSPHKPLGASESYLGEGIRKGGPLAAFAARGLSLNPGEGTQAQSRERMNSVPPQPPAPSRQLPATLLKIPGPGPSPGHSVSGLEVAQSWGNPGRQVSDASRSRKWWNWTRNWIRAGSSHFKSLQCLPPSPYSQCGPTCSGHMQDLEVQTPIQEEHRCRGIWGELLATTWSHHCPELMPSSDLGWLPGHRGEM